MAALFDRMGVGVGRQLGRPNGLAGRLVGAAMRVANKGPTDALLWAMAVQEGERVLDIGCGDGSLLEALPQASVRAGVDRSALMVSQARKRLAKFSRGALADIKPGDMMDLPFPARSFDCLFASNILYFCADVPGFIAECRRMARPGGRLGIYVTAAESMAQWRIASATTHRHFTKEGLLREIGRAGITPSAISLKRIGVTRNVEGLVAVVHLT